MSIGAGQWCARAGLPGQIGPGGPPDIASRRARHHPAMLVASSCAFWRCGHTNTSDRPDRPLASDSRQVIDALVGLGFGASLISIFAVSAAASSPRARRWRATSLGRVEARHRKTTGKPRNHRDNSSATQCRRTCGRALAADLFETYAGDVRRHMVWQPIFYWRPRTFLPRRMLYRWPHCGASIIYLDHRHLFRQARPERIIMGGSLQGPDL